MSRRAWCEVEATGAVARDVAGRWELQASLCEYTVWSIVGFIASSEGREAASSLYTVHMLVSAALSGSDKVNRVGRSAWAQRGCLCLCLKRAATGRLIEELQSHSGAKSGGSCVIEYGYLLCCIEAWEAPGLELTQRSWRL